jgi:hypothetical protein
VILASTNFPYLPEAGRVDGSSPRGVDAVAAEPSHQTFLGYVRHTGVGRFRLHDLRCDGATMTHEADGTARA